MREKQWRIKEIDPARKTFLSVARCKNPYRLIVPQYLYQQLTVGWRESSTFFHEHSVRTTLALLTNLFLSTGLYSGKRPYDNGRILMV